MLNDIPTSRCPVCQTKLDCCSHPSDDTVLPVQGDLTICLYCGEILMFDVDMNLKSPTPEEIVEADLLELSRAQRIVREYQQHIREGGD